MFPRADLWQFEGDAVLSAPNGTRKRHPAPPLQECPPDRLRGHGRDLPSRGRGPRPHGCDQGPRRAVRARRIGPGAVHTRGARSRAPLRGAEHDHDLRRRRVGRPSVHRHGASRGRLPRGPAEGGNAVERRGARLARAGCGRTGRRTPERRRPSRRQAREPAPRPGGQPSRRRLRDRERGRHGLADDRPGPCSARPATSRPSRLRASAPGRRATATRWGSSPSSSSPGGAPSSRTAPTAEAAAHVHAEIPSVSERLDPVFQRALAKEPGDRFETSAELVQALRDALDPGSHTTRRLAPAASRAAVVRAARRLVRRGCGDRRRRPRCDPHRRRRGDGRPDASHAPRRLLPPPRRRLRRRRLHRRRRHLLRHRRRAATGWRSPTRRRACFRRATGPAQSGSRGRPSPLLQGSGQTYEAYAEYDLGLALAQLGRCDEALAHLDRSQELQGHRKEIDQARRLCKRKGKKEK